MVLHLCVQPWVLSTHSLAPRTLQTELTPQMVSGEEVTVLVWGEDSWVPSASPSLCQPPFLRTVAPTAPSGNSSLCRGLLPGETGWAGLLLAGVTGFSWPTATLVAVQDEAGPRPTMLLYLISSTSGLPHPHFPLAQPRLCTQEFQGYVGSGCAHSCQPQRDSPHPPRESPATRQHLDAQPQQSFFTVVNSPASTRGLEVSVCTVAGG